MNIGPNALRRKLKLVPGSPDRPLAAELLRLPMIRSKARNWAAGTAVALLLGVDLALADGMDPQHAELADTVAEIDSQ